MNSQLHKENASRKKVRAALVGAGYLGGFHAEKLASHPDVELVAISDLNESRLRELAAKHGCQTTTDYKTLAGQVDCVLIASTTSAHFAVASFFAQTGLPLFIEKPITGTLAEGRELLALQDKQGSPIMVGHIERFNPVLIRCREMLAEVSPLFYRFFRRGPFRERGSDVSVLHDLMIHDFDLLRYWTDCHSLEITFQALKAIKTSLIDQAVCAGLTDTGILFELEASRVWSEPQRGVHVVGRNATLEVNSVTQVIKKVDHSTGQITEEVVPKADAMKAEVASFIERVMIQRTEPLISARDGFWNLEQVEKVIAGGVKA